MANDTTLRVRYLTGASLYVQIQIGDLVWNKDTLAWEVFTASNWAHYAVPFVEFAGGVGYYSINFLALGFAAGNYSWPVFLQQGATPAAGDGPPITTGNGFWDGTTFGPGLDAIRAAKIDNLTAPLGTPAGASIAADLATVNASLIGFYITGTVNDASPQAGTFVVSRTDGGTMPDTNDFVGLWLCFVKGTTCYPDKQPITGYTKLTESTARLSFTNPFSRSPANSDAFNIL